MARLHSIDSLTPSLEISLVLQYYSLVTCVSDVINNIALALDYSFSKSDWWNQRELRDNKNDSQLLALG